MSRPRKDPDDDDSGLVRRLLPFERDFTQIPNDWMRDERLSYRARGLLALLMTHDHGYRVTLRGLAGATPKAAKGEGLDGLRAAVEELEATGYLFRRPSKKGGRFVADRWEICDPSGTYDPGLFALAGVVDKPHRNRVASANAERSAWPQPTRTAWPQPTTVRTQAKNTRATPEAASPSASPSPGDLWRTCPAPTAVASLHQFDPTHGRCVLCAQARDDGTVYDRHGTVIGHFGEADMGALRAITTSKEGSHAISS